MARPNTYLPSWLEPDPTPSRREREDPPRYEDRGGPVPHYSHLNVTRYDEDPRRGRTATLRTLRRWEIGDFCCIPAAHGPPQNGYVESLLPNERVRILTMEGHFVDVAAIDVMRPTVSVVVTWTKEDVTQWLLSLGPPADFAASLFYDNNIDGVRLLRLTMWEMRQLGCSEEESAAIHFAVMQLHEAEDVQTPRHSSAPPPEYLHPPSFDEPDDFEMAPLTQLHSENSPERMVVRITDADDSPTGEEEMRHHNSVLGMGAYPRQRSTRQAARRGTVLPERVDSELLLMDDDDILASVETRQAAIDKLKRQQNPLQERLVQYREEQHLVKKEMVYLSVKERIKLAYHSVSSSVWVFTHNTLSVHLWRNDIKTIAGKFGSPVASYFDFLRFCLYLNLMMTVLWVSFVIIPQSTSSTPVVAWPNNYSYPSNTYFGAITAGSWEWEFSLLFYGYYTPNFIHSSFNLPVSYFLVTVFFLLFSLSFIAYSIASVFSLNFTHDTSRQYSVFSEMVLARWDHSLTYRRSVSRNKLHFARELQELLKVSLGYSKPSTNRFAHFFASALAKFTLRLLMNLLFLGLLFFLCAIIRIMYFRNAENDLDTKYFRSSATAFTLTMWNFIVPHLIKFLSPIEMYTAETLLRVILFRTVLFRACTLGTYIVCFFLKHDYSTEACWENHFGQEIYRLFMFDFAIVVIADILYHLVRLVLHNVAKLRKAEFNISINILDTVYRLSLVWIGAFFCPFLPAMTSISLFIIFYIKHYIVLYSCRPTARLTRLSNGTNLFKQVLLVALFLSLTVVSWATIHRTPSASCGPFQGKAYMFHVIYDTIDTFPTWLRSICFFVGTPGFAIPIVLLLMFAVVYVRFHANAKVMAVKKLRTWLTVERLDTKKLLRIRKIQT